MNLHHVSLSASLLALVTAACAAPAEEEKASQTNHLESKRADDDTDATGDPAASTDDEKLASGYDASLYASIPLAGGQCLQTDSSCFLQAGGAVGAIYLGATSCGVTFDAAVAALICQVGLLGPEDPLADFCSGAMLSLASSSARVCLATVAVSGAAIDAARSACIKPCGGTG